MKYKTAKKKSKNCAANGLVNADMSAPQGGQQPMQPGQGGPTQGQQPGQGGGISVDVTLAVNANGASQPLGSMSIKQPDDVKKLVQMIVSVFSQGGGQQGQQPGQPENEPQQ